MKEHNENNKHIQNSGQKDILQINQITDDKSLFRFCQQKIKKKKELSDQDKTDLAKQIKNSIFNKNKKLSIATIFELSILILRKVDLSKLGDELAKYIDKCYIYKHLDFYDSCAEHGQYFKNFKPVFEFINKRKTGAKNQQKYLSSYINLLRGFIIPLWNSEPLCATDFFNLELINFKDTNSYNGLSSEGFDHLIEILKSYFNRDKNKNNKKQIVDAMYDILKFAPSKFLYKNNIVRLIPFLKNNVFFDGQRIHEIIERLITLDAYKFPCILMILSYCENNFVPGDIFKKAINRWAKNKKDLFKSFSLKILEKKRGELNNQGKDVAEIENKYNKYIFTPSLINFIKQKFNFDENYDLEQVLKSNFGEDNFAEGDNRDLEVIMYRLFFEDYMLVPHKKEEVIKLFETTKIFLPPYGKSLKESFYSDFANIWDITIAYEFFENMNTLAQEIILERWQKRTKFSLVDLKIIALSNFKFGALRNINKNHNTQYLWRNDFFDRIPNKIDDKYYFRWILQIFQNQSQGISKEHLTRLLKSYKFIDISDFDDFCLAMKNILVVDYYALDVTVDKIKVESDADILSALLDSCDDTTFQNNPFNSMSYMREIIFKTRNQELIDKMNNKFNLHLRLIEKNTLLPLKDNRGKHITTVEENTCSCISFGFVLLTIITLGGIFWMPWLFKKIFGCCYDFGDDNISDNKNKNLRSSQNLIPDQSSSLEENLGKQKTNQNVK